MTFFPGRAKKGQRPLSLGAAARELFDTRVFSLPPCGGSRADFAKAELSPARDPGIASYPLELFRHRGPNKKSWPSPLEGDRGPTLRKRSFRRPETRGSRLARSSFSDTAAQIENCGLPPASGQRAWGKVPAALRSSARRGRKGGP